MADPTTPAACTCGPPAPTTPEAADELTAEEARALAGELGLALYRAEDAVEFAREMCDIADRNGTTTVPVARVRRWLDGVKCGRQMLAGAAEVPTGPGTTTQPRDVPVCGAPHDTYPETVCTEPPRHRLPHGGPLIINGRHCGGAAWGPDHGTALAAVATQPPVPCHLCDGAPLIPPTHWTKHLRDVHPDAQAAPAPALLAVITATLEDYAGFHPATQARHVAQRLIDWADTTTPSTYRPDKESR